MAEKISKINILICKSFDSKDLHNILELQNHKHIDLVNNLKTAIRKILILYNADDLEHINYSINIKSESDINFNGSFN